MAVLEPAMTRAFFFWGLLILVAATPAAAQPRIDTGRALAFGAIVAGPQGGSVTVAPDGTPACSGVTCIGGASAGEFFVTGAQDVAVAVSTSRATLDNGAGATMAVTLTPSVNTLVLRAGDRANRFTIGGTLTLAPNQPPGDYRGEYLVLLDYL